MADRSQLMPRACILVFLVLVVPGAHAWHGFAEVRESRVLLEANAPISVPSEREGSTSKQTGVDCSNFGRKLPTATAEVVRSCLELEFIGRDHRTIWLQIAAGLNANPSVIEALVAAGADVRARDGDGQTPLHRAGAFNENSSMIEALVAAGADVEARVEGGWQEGQTPLHRAASFNENPSVIEALVAAGADVEARVEGGRWEGQTPLHRAAMLNENPSVIEALVAAGADVRARDGDGQTPLHAGAFNENPSVIEALVAAGADVEARVEGGWQEGQTPLHRAASFNENPSVIEALVAAGADVRARDGDGQTPLHSVAGSNENPAVIEALVAAGADARARDGDGRTPLHSAAASMYDNSSVEALLAVGSDPSVRSEAGSTPLHLAARNWASPTDKIKPLLDAGADPLAPDGRGKTPWDYAQENQALQGSDAYWDMNDARFDSPNFGQTRPPGAASPGERRGGGDVGTPRTTSGAGSATSGQCEIPGVAEGDPALFDPNNIRLSWCNVAGQIQYLALDAELLRCQFNTPGGVLPDRVGEFREAMKRSCDTVDAMATHGGVDCRCPQSYRDLGSN